MAYRLIVKDKLNHVICRLQSLLKGQLHNLKDLPVPDFLELQDMDVNLLASLQLSDKLNGKYDTAKIIFGLKLKLEATGIITLIGAAERCWSKPTLPSDEAKSAGIQWKGFQLDLAQTLENVGTLPSRFSRLCESIELTITYLQRKMTIEAETKWCEYVISLGMLPKLLQNEKFGIKLPTWFSQESYKNIIDAIKKNKKTVNIEQQDGTKPKVLKHFPDIVAEQEGQLIKVTTLFSKMEIKGSKKIARDNDDESSGENTADDDLNDGNLTYHGSSAFSYQTSPPAVSSNLLTFAAQENSQGARRKETSPNTGFFPSGRMKHGEGFHARESGVYDKLSSRARQGEEFHARDSGVYDKLSGRATRGEEFHARESGEYDKLLVEQHEVKNPMQEIIVFMTNYLQEQHEVKIFRQEIVVFMKNYYHLLETY